MAIPSKEIGWGTEENLLWQISKQLETLTNVTYSSGSSSTTYVPYTGAISNVNLGSYNISANSFINGFSSITASGTQVVLTVDSAPEILVSGSGGQTIKLPDATTLANGTIFTFNNNQSSGAITVNNNSNTLVLSIPSGGYAEIMLLSNSIAAGSWDKHFQAPSNVSWSTNTLDYPGSITSATWNGVVVAPNRGGTGQSTYTDGQLLIGNTTGNTLSKSTLTAGTGISIANGNGSITITATGAVSGAVTGSGTTNYVPKFTSSTVVGDSNIQDSGSLITLGSTTYISSGALGIGTNVLTNYSLRVSKTITGAVTGFGISQQGIVQSDVTFLGHGFHNLLITQATSFTIGNYVHYSANQGTIGAGSTVSVQYGFSADATMIGATTNYGFFGNIPSGTNRWNIYMLGTAANYMAGDTSIGTTSLGTATKFTLGGSETASSAIARGQLLNTTLVASANSDVLVGLDIIPTFTAGSFSSLAKTPFRAYMDSTNNSWIRYHNNNSVGNYHTFEIRNDVTTGGASASLQSVVQTRVNYIITYGPGDTGTIFGASTAGAAANISENVSRMLFGTINAADVIMGANNTAAMRIYNSTRNIVIQNGGTFTDEASARLVVNSTTQGVLFPRMTTTEKNAISSPATGLVVFDTTLGKLCVRGASAWETISSS
jgi:hypothetical protein